MSEPLNYEGPTKAEVLAKVTAFLETPVHADGDGWTPVTNEDLREVWDLFADILEAKYERDCDGDMVMEIEMNRRNAGQMVALRTPLMHWEDPVDLEEAMRTIQYINNMTASMVERIAGSIQLRESARKEAEAWAEKCVNIAAFCALYKVLVSPSKEGATMIRRLESWMLDECKGVFAGSDDNVWSPLGITCQDIRTRKPNDLFELIDGAAKAWLERNQ